MGGLTIVGFGLGLAGAAVLAAIGTGYVRPPVDLTLAEAEAAYDNCQRFVREDFKAPGPFTFAQSAGTRHAGSPTAATAFARTPTW